jgi:coproporphyrinogen III oxidase-like Fe-S oxidoreductase
MYIKKATGIDITNTKYYNMLQNLKQYDFIEENENIIQLTKKGAFYADEICQLFYCLNLYLLADLCIMKGR